MNQFQGKIAIVTGASSGIGAAIAKAFAEAGMIVAGFARRKERMEELSKQLGKPLGELHAIKVDMRNEEDVSQAFHWVTNNLGPVHILINSAGGTAPTTLVDGDAQLWKSIVDTNVLGTAMASREAIKIMRANNIDGHIININSVTGHNVPHFFGFNIYPASKFAITALTETLRLELVRLGSKIKVTSLSPGLVDTEGVLRSGSTLEDFMKAHRMTQSLVCEDIVNAVDYIISTPPRVQITELTIRAVGDTL